MPRFRRTYSSDDEQEEFVNLKIEEGQIDKFIRQNQYCNDELSDDEVKSDSIQLNQDQFENYNDDLRKQITKVISEHFCILNHKQNIQIYIHAFQLQKKLNFITFQNLSTKDALKVKEETANKLIQLRKVAYNFVLRGNTMHGVRQTFNNALINQGLYLRSICFIMKIMINQMQKYIEQRCHKAIKPIKEVKNINQVVRQMLDYKNYFDLQQTQTFMKILKCIFKLEKVTFIANKEIFRFYKALRRVQIRNIAQEDQNKLHVEYYKYDNNNKKLSKQSPDFKQFQEQNQLQQGIHEQEQAYSYSWEEIMNKRIVKGFLVCKDLWELKGNLQRIYTVNNRKFQLNLLRKKIDNICKKSITFIQNDFKTVCKLKKITKIDFASKKLLTLNNFQKFVFVTHIQSHNVRKLVLDYYLNNNWPEKTNQKDYTEYRLVYLKYTISAITQFLEQKKYIKYVCTETIEEKLQQYDLQQIQQGIFEIVNEANVYYRQVRRQGQKFDKLMMQKDRFTEVQDEQNDKKDLLNFVQKSEYQIRNKKQKLSKNVFLSQARNISKQNNNPKQQTLQSQQSQIQVQQLSQIYGQYSENQNEIDKINRKQRRQNIIKVKKEEQKRSQKLKRQLKRKLMKINARQKQMKERQKLKQIKLTSLIYLKQFSAKQSQQNINMAEKDFSQNN